MLVSCFALIVPLLTFNLYITENVCSVVVRAIYVKGVDNSLGDSNLN